MVDVRRWSAADGPDPTERDVYTCVSPALTDAVRTSLRRAGLPLERLHEERFAF